MDVGAEFTQRLDLITRSASATNTTAMSVLSNGNVGIAGASNPTAKFEIGASATGYVSQLKVFANSTNSYFELSNQNGNNSLDLRMTRSDGSENFFVNGHTGKVGIGTIAPSVALHVVGDICYTGSIGACSDLRYKKNITPLPNALTNILKLQGVNYDWKMTEFPEKQFVNTKQIGFIAQELEKIYPEMVITDKEGFKSVDYSRLTPVLVEAIKELNTKNEGLQKLVDKLQVENSEIKKENNETKAEAEYRLKRLEAQVESIMKSNIKEEAKK